jgi:hypothetical protein
MILVIDPTSFPKSKLPRFIGYEANGGSRQIPPDHLPSSGLVAEEEQGERWTRMMIVVDGFEIYTKTSGSVFEFRRCLLIKGSGDSLAVVQVAAALRLFLRIPVIVS